MDDKSNQMWVSCRCGGPGGRPGHDWVDVLDLTSERSIARTGGPPLVGGPIALSPDRATIWIDGSDACIGPQYDHTGCPSVPGGVVHAIRTSDRTFVRSIAAPEQGRPIPRPDGSGAVLATSKGLSVIDAASFRTVERWDRVIPWVSFTRNGERAFFSAADDNTIVESTPGSRACEPAMEGLQHFWSGDGTATDLAGAGHGRIEKDAHFAPGLVGQAFFFEGDDDRIVFGGVAGSGRPYWGLSAPETLSLWVKFVGPARQEEVVLESRRTGGALIWRLLRSTDGRVSFETIAKPDSVVLSTKSPVPSDAWQHLTLVNTGSQLRLYLNGIREAQRDHRLIADSGSTISLGGEASGGSFAGLIDEIALHIGEFTDEQILNSHRAFVSACVSPALTVNR